MNDVVTFYYNPMSRGRIVHWMLEEVGAKYETKILSFDKREHKSPEYLKINPMGKLPAIVHRGNVVTEGAAICAYLADAFPAAKLAPPVSDRAAYYRWLFFGAGCIDAALVDKQLGRGIPEGKKGHVGYGSLDDVANALEIGLKGGSFLTGNQFTAADLYVASQINWGFRTESLQPRPVFKSFLARCTDRPAFKRVEEQVMKLMDQAKKTA